MKCFDDLSKWLDCSLPVCFHQRAAVPAHLGTPAAHVHLGHDTAPADPAARPPRHGVRSRGEGAVWRVWRGEDLCGDDNDRDRRAVQSTAGRLLLRVQVLRVGQLRPLHAQCMYIVCVHFVSVQCTSTTSGPAPSTTCITYVHSMCTLCISSVNTDCLYQDSKASRGYW